MNIIKSHTKHHNTLTNLNSFLVAITYKEFKKIKNQGTVKTHVEVFINQIVNGLKVVTSDGIIKSFFLLYKLPYSVHEEIYINIKYTK